MPLLGKISWGMGTPPFSFIGISNEEMGVKEGDQGGVSLVVKD
jgi:hypothetical protein